MKKSSDMISELFEKPGLKRSKEEDEVLIEYFLRRFRVGWEKC